jgi:hypothetical protein
MNNRQYFYGNTTEKNSDKYIQLSLNSDYNSKNYLEYPIVLTRFCNEVYDKDMHLRYHKIEYNKINFIDIKSNTFFGKKSTERTKKILSLIFDGDQDFLIIHYYGNIDPKTPDNSNFFNFLYDYNFKKKKKIYLEYLLIDQNNYNDFSKHYEWLEKLKKNPMFTEIIIIYKVYRSAESNDELNDYEEYEEYIKKEQ